MDRYNSWEKSRWHYSPRACNINTMGSCDFEKYLLICTSECMSIWGISICQSHMTKYIVMMGRSVPAILLFRGIPAVQFWWSTETSPKWRYLQYCFIKFIFQSDTVLYLYLFKFYSTCVMSACTQKVSIMWRK